MTLAVFLCVSIVCAPPARLPAAAARATSLQDSTQTSTPDKAAPPAQPSSTQTASPAQSPSGTSQAAPAPTTGKAPQNGAGTPAVHRRHHKKSVQVNCLSAAPTPDPAASGSSASNSTGASAAPAGSAAPPTAATASTNCPPTKVIVRQGGTSEPSLQLAGGDVGNKASRERATANQMLEQTEQNLKKLEGRSLTTNQQDVVNQIRQFMEQSKGAVTAGDLDRARTLAWKAQTLSDDLLKPQQ